MKVLFLSHIPFYPAIGGDKVRISQALSFLLESAEVDIAFLSKKGVDAGVENEIHQFDDRIGMIRNFEESKFGRLIQAARSLTNGYPYEVNLYHNREMSRFVRESAPKYDVVYCSGVATAIYGLQLASEEVYKGKLILDMTDAMTKNLERHYDISHGLRRIFLGVNKDRMRRYEVNCANVFDKVSYISEADRTYLGIDKSRTCVVPNYVNRVTEICDMERDYDSLLFVGKMNYAPNISAAVFFTEKVMPLLPSYFRFDIVGAKPVREVKNLSKVVGVGVKGFVEDIVPYYLSCGLFVAPMLNGSGIQNKILEAMSYGCCVVTTPYGAEGLESVKEGLVVCNLDSHAIAGKILELHQNPHRIREIGEMAKILIERKFGREAVRGKFKDFLNFC